MFNDWVNDNRKQGYLCILSTFLLFIIYLFVPFTYDELHSWNLLTLAISSKELFHFLSVNETQAPLFYLLNIFMPEGFPVWAYRLPSILFWMGAQYFTYRFVEILYGRKASWYAQLIFITSMLGIHYAPLFRPYGLFLFLSSLSLFFYVKKNNVGLIVTAFLMPLTHYYGVLSAFFILSLLVRSQKAFIPILLFIPLITFYQTGFFINISKVHDDRVVPSLLTTLGLAAMFMQPIAFYIFFGRKILTRRLWNYLSLSFEAPYLVFVVATSLIVSYGISPSFENRYFIFLLPTFCSLMGRSLSQIDIRPKKFYLIILLLFINPLFKLDRLSDYEPRSVEELIHLKPNGKRVFSYMQACPKFYLPRDIECIHNVEEFLGINESDFILLVSESRRKLFLDRYSDSYHRIETIKKINNFSLLLVQK